MSRLLMDKRNEEQVLDRTKDTEKGGEEFGISLTNARIMTILLRQTVAGDPVTEAITCRPRRRGRRLMIPPEFAGLQ